MQKHIKHSSLRALSLTVPAAFLLSVAGMAQLSLLTAPAYADVASSKAIVDAAKAKGIVGEGSNGYLGFVTGSADPATTAAVDEINAGRQSVYAAAAAKNNVTIEAAAGSAYTNVILPKVKPGEYYQTATGLWVKK